MKRLLDRASWVAVILLGLFVALRLSGCGGVAPTPELFSDGQTLDGAMEQSAAPGGKPVLAVATADWCPPCQSYKRGALADARVAEAVRARTIPVYVDVDADPDAAAALGVSSIPATYLIVDGAVAASFTGAKGADELLRWIDEHTPGG